MRWLGHNWVKWPEHESDHKPSYNVEIMCGAIILCLYMNVRSIYMASTLISCGAFVPLPVKWPLHTRRVSRIMVKALVTSSIIQSVCLVGKGRLKERCRLEPQTSFFFRLRNRRNLVRIRFGCGLDSKIYGIWNILSPIANTYWTRWWPLSRPKHVILLTTDNKLVVFLTTLHCAFMLHTQRGCLNSRG